MEVQANSITRASVQNWRHFLWVHHSWYTSESQTNLHIWPTVGNHQFQRRWPRFIISGVYPVLLLVSLDDEPHKLIMTILVNPFITRCYGHHHDQPVAIIINDHDKPLPNQSPTIHHHWFLMSLDVSKSSDHRDMLPPAPATASGEMLHLSKATICKHHY